MKRATYLKTTIMKPNRIKPLLIFSWLLLVPFFSGAVGAAFAGIAMLIISSLYDTPTINIIYVIGVFFLLGLALGYYLGFPIFCRQWRSINEGLKGV